MASLKEQNTDQLIGIADDLLTVFGRSPSPFDRAMAAIDLIVWTDLKTRQGRFIETCKE